MDREWKFWGLVASIIVSSTLFGYLQGGTQGAINCFLLSLCGTGLGYVIGRFWSGR